MVFSTIHLSEWGIVDDDDDDGDGIPDEDEDYDGDGIKNKGTSSIVYFYFNNLITCVWWIVEISNNQECFGIL